MYIFYSWCLPWCISYSSSFPLCSVKNSTCYTGAKTKYLVPAFMHFRKIYMWQNKKQNMLYCFFIFLSLLFVLASPTFSVPLHLTEQKPKWSWVSVYWKSGGLHKNSKSVLSVPHRKPVAPSGCVDNKIQLSLMHIMSRWGSHWPSGPWSKSKEEICLWKYK